MFRKDRPKFQGIMMFFISKINHNYPEIEMSYRYRRLEIFLAPLNPKLSRGIIAIITQKLNVVKFFFVSRYHYCYWFWQSQCSGFLVLKFKCRRVLFFESRCHVYFGFDIFIWWFFICGIKWWMSLVCY